MQSEDTTTLGTLLDDKTMNITNSFLLEILCISFAALAHADGPGGIQVHDETRIRVNRSQAIMFNAEVCSFQKDLFARNYIAALSSTNLNERCFAANALGRFHSRIVIDALFGRVVEETNLDCLKEICRSLDGLFFEQIPNCDPEHGDVTQIKRQIAEWRRTFESLDYPGFFIHEFDRLSSNAEGEKILVVGISETYDMELLPVLLHAWERSTQEGVKLLCKNAILTWSGLDLDVQELNQVKSDLKSVNALTPERISTRYATFFHKNGYPENRDEKLTAAAILLSEKSEKKEILRIMAFRYLAR